MAEFARRGTGRTYAAYIMTQNFIWTFNDSALASGLNGVFSLEYHVPGSKIKVPPEELAGARIWLAVRIDNENYLYALLTPTIVELYQEGKYKDDFILRCEPFSSVRFLPRHESISPWQLPFKTDEGIRECVNVEQAAILEMIEKNQRVGFAPPPRQILESIPHTAFSDLESSVPDQLMSTLRTIAYGDTSRSRSMPDSISAFGGLTLALLKETHPQLNEEDVISLIVALDPLAKTKEGEQLKSPKEILRVLSSLPPVVDTFFEEIDPEKISPRTFVAKTTDSSLEWLDKTNDAEQAHEGILKDLVLHLKGNGFKVYKTRSFDLFAEKENTRLLWEIKSANRDNSVAQGEKGIMQLLRYSTALANEKMTGVRFMLLLQYSSVDAVHQYLSRMTQRSGLELWLYNSDVEWPRRVSSLPGKNISTL